MVHRVQNTHTIRSFRATGVFRIPTISVGSHDNSWGTILWRQWRWRGPAGKLLSLPRRRECTIHSLSTSPLRAGAESWQAAAAGPLGRLWVGRAQGGGRGGGSVFFTSRSNPFQVAPSPSRRVSCGDPDSRRARSWRAKDTGGRGE
eukprot:gene3538-biopygen15796